MITIPHIDGVVSDKDLKKYLLIMLPNIQLVTNGENN